MAYALVRVVEHPHRRRGRQPWVGCGPVSYFFVGVPAEPLDHLGSRLRVVQGQLAHRRTIAGVAPQDAVFVTENARFFSEPLPGRAEPLGSPGGAAELGPVGVDTPFVQNYLAP